MCIKVLIFIMDKTVFKAGIAYYVNQELLFSVKCETMRACTPFARAGRQMEVVKTRMQLQGELVLRRNASTHPTAAAAATSNNGKIGSGQHQHGYRPPYRNALDAFYKICRDEGFRGIQAGLLPGLMYQVLCLCGLFRRRLQLCITTRSLRLLIF